MMKRIIFLLLILPAVVLGQGYFDGYVTGSASFDVSTDEIVTMAFATDPTQDHALTAFDSAMANSDEVLRLGVGYDAPEFAWVQIDSATAPTASIWLEYTNRHSYEDFRTTADNDFRITDTDYPRLDLLYVDWLAHIPAGATILSAEVHVQTAGAWSHTVHDTVCSTLITGADDSVWHGSKGVILGADAAPNMAYSNWSYAVAPLDTIGYPASGAAWKPGLATRTAFEEWGDISDWSHMGASPVPTESEYSFSIKNCVQNAVNGKTNNGIMTYIKRSGTETRFPRYTWEPRPGHASWTKIPWITVTYSTKKYKKPFPGGEFCFLFTTDDGLVDANDAYSDVFGEFGWNYSAYYAKVHFTGNLNAPTASSMLAVRDAGNEVGAHSVQHLPIAGIAQWDANGMAGAEWDSLIRDTRPEWMYTLADSVDGYDYAEMEGDRYFAKSFATPLNVIDQEGLFALVQHGYTGFRTGSQIRGVNPEFFPDYYLTTVYRADVSDTFRVVGIPENMLNPQDMMGVPVTFGINSVVGEKADTTITEAEVKWNMKRALRQQMATNYNVLSLYVHNFKTDPSYTSGLDEEELRWMLEVVQDMGGTCMRLSDYQNWRKVFATPVATPAAYGQIDSFKFEASDAVWFEPTPETRLYPYEDE